MNCVNEDVIEQLLKPNRSDEITVLNYEIKKNIIDEGSNFCSDVCQLIVTCAKNGETCEKLFVLKIPSNIASYENLAGLGLYLKEVHMYESVLPRFRTLLPAERFAPEHYFTGVKETLILEDLRQCGYKVRSKCEQLDFEHTAAVLRQLAKFHAASVAVEQNTTKILDAVREEHIYSSDSFKQQMQSIFEKRAQIVLNRESLSWANDSSDSLSGFRKQLLPSALDEMKPKPDTFNVLNHGDFWTSNVMFKYDAYGNVENVKFVDFQMCRWTSPAIDVLNFFTTSVRFEIFEKYFDLLLKIYANTLNRVLTYLGCDYVYNIDDLYKDIESKYNFWIFTLIHATSMIFFDPGKYSAFDPFDVSPLADERFVRLSRKWISYFKRKGVFSKELGDVPVTIDTSKLQF